MTEPQPWCSTCRNETCECAHLDIAYEETDR